MGQESNPQVMDGRNWVFRVALHVIGAGLSGVSFLACWAGVPRAAGQITIPVEAKVASARIGHAEARFRIITPFEADAIFSFDRCEWAGVGRLRTDRACVGWFQVQARRGRFSGPARAYISAYGRILALHGTIRESSGCFAGIIDGEVVRDGPVMIETLPLRMKLIATRNLPSIPRARSDLSDLARVAHARHPATSLAALEVFARALASEAEDIRIQAAVALGYAASEPVFDVFREALAQETGLLREAMAAREMKGEPLPSRCDGPMVAGSELETFCTRAAVGEERHTAFLTDALEARAREVRREAAFGLARLGNHRAREILERALNRAVHQGDWVSALDFAEALLALGASREGRDVP